MGIGCFFFAFPVLRKKSGIFVVDTNKAGVRFRNSELEGLNKQFLEYSSNYDQHQQYVVSEILAIAEGYVIHDYWHFHTID